MVSLVVLALAVAIGAFYDIRERRIPNWITVPALLSGLLLHGINGGSAGLTAGLIGAVSGAALLGLPFAAGWVGGGDLKLLAAIGALMGAPFALWTLVFASAVGGVIAIATLAMNGALGGSLIYVFGSWTRSVGVKPAVLSKAFSFGPALAVGALVAQFWVK